MKPSRGFLLCNRACLALASAICVAGFASGSAFPKTPWLHAGETLVCYGDSITARPGYFQIISNELAAAGVRVVNAGVGGDNTETAMARIRDVAAHRADAVMIFLGTNDSACGRGMWQGEPTIEPVTYRDNLLWMVHYLRQHGTRKFCLVPSTGRIEGTQYHAFANRRELYNQMTREAADRCNAVFVPLDVIFDEARKLRMPDEKGHVFTVDDVHLTDEGSALVARTLLETWKMSVKP